MVTGDSKEEVMIFHDTNTNKQNLPIMMMTVMMMTIMTTTAGFGHAQLGVRKVQTH